MKDNERAIWARFSWRSAVPFRQIEQLGLVRWSLGGQLALLVIEKRRDAYLFFFKEELR